MLCQAGEKHGFTVANTETHILDGDRVSSTRIRHLLGENQLDQAEQMLGRRYSITGRVMHGQKLGRQLGVPTANVRMHRFASPLRGVYAVTVSLPGETPMHGVANIGMRPTVQGTQPVLESHIFDFDGDLYGRLLTVQFDAFIRDERKFDGIEELKKQIYNDIEQARAFFGAQ